jgi:hypothetical protein
VIENVRGKYALICDVCGFKHPDGPFKTYNEALAVAEKEGWTTDSLLTDEDVEQCPGCSRED